MQQFVLIDYIKYEKVKKSCVFRSYAGLRTGI